MDSLALRFFESHHGLRQAVEILEQKASAGNKTS